MAVTRPSPEILTRILQQHFGDDTVRCTSCQRSAIGNGQEIWLIATSAAGGSSQYVLRRTAPGGPLEWTDRRTEATVMNAMARAALPVPYVHIMRDQDSELDLPYMIMDRAHGKPGATAPREHRAWIATQVAQVLPSVHAVDVREALGAESQITQQEAVLVQLDEWRARYFADRPFPVPMLLALIDDLAERAPTADDMACAVWGDPGYHNVLADDEGNVTALLDWELAHLGHPLEDLGVLVWMETGRVDGTDIVAAYEAVACRLVHPEDLRYFVALSCVTRSVMVLAGLNSALQAKTSEPSTVALGMHLLMDSMQRAATLLNWPTRLPFAEPGPRPACPNEHESGPPLHHYLSDVIPGISSIEAVLARYLQDEILPAITDQRLVRGLKTAAALLEANAHRDALSAEVGAARQELAQHLFALVDKSRPPAPADLESLVVRSRSGGDFHSIREVVQAYLQADLRHQRELIGPLDKLYGSTSAAVKPT